jgi:hypothetical protein
MAASLAVINWELSSVWEAVKIEAEHPKPEYPQC